MNKKYIADTVALILRLERRKLPVQVKHIFEQAEEGKAEIYIPAIVLAEVGYLSEKVKIETNLKEVSDYILQNKTINEQEMHQEIVIESFKIDDIPELHDRLIAGSAFTFNIQIITNDPIIQKSQHVDCIW